MSLPPPSRSTKQSPPSSTASPSTARASQGPVKYGKATPLPVLVALVGVALGSIPLFLGGDLGFEILGYVFAGFVPIMCLGWDAVSQRRGMVDPNFTPNKLYSILLRVLVAIGVAVAVYNIVNIAKPIAEWFSEL